MVGPPARRPQVVLPQAVLSEVLKPWNAGAPAAGQKLMPAPQLDGGFVEPGVGRVTSLTIHDDLLQGVAELPPRPDLADADAGLIEHALAIQHQVAEQQQRGDVFFALIRPCVPPRLGQIVAILLRPRFEHRRKVLERAQPDRGCDVGRAEQTDVGRGIGRPGGHIFFADRFPGGLLPLDRDVRILRPKLLVDPFLRPITGGVAESRKVTHEADGRGCATGLLWAKCLLH